MLQSLNKRYSISVIKSKLAKNVIDHILVTRAISGCDGTSAIYKRAKKTAFKLINNVFNLTFLGIFKSKNLTKEEIEAVGERLMLLINSEPASVSSLDDLGYVRYKKQVAKKSLTAGTR